MEEKKNRWEIHLNLLPGKSNLLATGEAILDNLYRISPVKVVQIQKEGKDQLLFLLPNIAKSQNGETKWEGVFEFTSFDARKEFEQAMVEGLREQLLKGIDEVEYKQNLKVEVKPINHPSLKGTATIEYDNILRIKNVRLIEGKHGQFISYPQTEDSPSKEKREMRSILAGIEERLTDICVQQSISNTARQELMQLKEYVKEQEKKLSQVNYADVIQSDHYFFKSYIEDAVKAEYAKHMQKQEGQKIPFEGYQKKAAAVH